MSPSHVADREGRQEPKGDFTTDQILAVINEFRTMRKYFDDTSQIDAFIEEFESMLKYATA